MYGAFITTPIIGRSQTNSTQKSKLQKPSKVTLAGAGQTDNRGGGRNEEENEEWM